MSLECCCDPAYGSGSSGGGGENLAATLVIGNFTGGTAILVTTGDEIVGQTNLILQSTAGDVQLAPAGGTATVGAQSIITTLSSAGGTSIVLAKAAGGANGADQPLRSFTSAGGTVAITTPTPTTINLEAAGGATETWAATLVAGNVSGGTDPVISTGDEILGQTQLNLRSQGDGNIVTIRAADGSSAAVGQTRDVELFGGASSPASAVQGGRVLLWGGSGDGPAPGGTVRLTGGTGGSTSGTGGPVWLAGGQGGTPNGDGSEILIQAGNPQGFGQGGAVNIQGGDATGNTGGTINIRAGNTVSAFSSGANVNINAGNSASVHGGDVVITGGTAGGANNDGGDVRLVPTAQTGAGTPGSAFVGSQSIVTRASNLGAGGQVFAAKALDPSIDGSRLDFRSVVGTSPITVTQNANDLTISTTALAPSSGCEICLNDSVAGDIASTTRQMTIRGRQSVQTQYSVNFGAGTRTITMRARSLVAGQTTTIRNRSILAQSNLGTTNYDPETGVFTTTSNTFVNVTNSSTVLIAGEWIVFFSMDLETPV